MNVRFLPDPYDTEFIRRPLDLAGAILSGSPAYGDCDDIAVLTAATGRAVGLEARYRALSLRPDGQISHVRTELHPGIGPWLWSDPFAPNDLHIRATGEIIGTL